ncbi:MAG: Tat pathway signal protein [Halobacteriaceae archaeon]
MTRDSAGPSRRSVLRAGAAAVATGGLSAYAACLERSGNDLPRGPEDVSGYPERQHAWNDVLGRDDAGNVVPPRHRTLLLCDLRGSPDAAARRAVEASLRGVERAYQRGADGLLVTVAYSPGYFARHFDATAAGVDLPPPEPLAPFEDPTLDDPDALVHLASDHPRAVLGAEEALRGTNDTLNGVPQPGTALADHLAIRERRTGFVGAGLPAEHADVADVSADAVSDEAPLFMGFKSGLRSNQATEDRVTIGSGPFAGGSTLHLSHLSLDLSQWYEQDSRYQRVAKMFCPHHAETGAVEGVGANLGTDSGVDDCRPTAEAAREVGVVGHTQKTARARTDDDEPVILRRDFDSTDGETPGLHFLSLQREIGDFVATREAMNGTDVAADSAVGQRTNNGILQYLRTLRRGNYLLPPRAHRALPRPAPG